MIYDIFLHCWQYIFLCKLFLDSFLKMNAYIFILYEKWNFFLFLSTDSFYVLNCHHYQQKILMEICERNNLYKYRYTYDLTLWIKSLSLTFITFLLLMNSVDLLFLSLDDIMYPITESNIFPILFCFVCFEIVRSKLYVKMSSKFDMSKNKLSIWKDDYLSKLQNRISFLYRNFIFQKDFLRDGTVPC